MDFISVHGFPPVFSYIMLHIYAKADKTFLHFSIAYL